MLSAREQRQRIAEELARISRLPAGVESPASGGVPRPAQDGGGPEPIAIIGISGYFPGCMSVGAFWEALDEDRCLISRPSKDRTIPALRNAGLSDAQLRATGFGGFIPDIRGFSPSFFGILPGEAHWMDPRQRLLLMSVYHSLEDAGYAPLSFKRQAVGVFIGIEEDEYFHNLMELGIPDGAGDGPSSGLVANRISWFFDFRGPSEAVQTMCSGSAVAIHRAVSSLRSGETTMAVVGGANLMLRPEPFLRLAQTGQLTPSGVPRSFGKGADGFVRAECVATAILKPLGRAEMDGDPIYAVIRNTAVNYNGKGGLSMSSPDIAAHAQLVETCYRQAGVDPRTISYIEAQGMGHRVADLAEWQALNRALGNLATERGFSIQPGSCRVGTLKPMTGHAHSASALMAMFKVIRSLQTGTIHKIPGFTELDPDLMCRAQPCAPAALTEAWHSSGLPKLAGLHSYGAGGNNAHILLEEYPGGPGEDLPPPPYVFPLSAETPAQLTALTGSLLETVEKNPGLSMASIARTLQRGRDPQVCRVVFVVESRADWLEQARAWLAGEQRPNTGAAAGRNSAPEAGASSPQDLAAAWVHGAAIPAWPRSAAPCLHLPGYPFELMPCWHDLTKQFKPASESGPALKNAKMERGEAIIRELLAAYLETSPDRLDMDAAMVDLGFNSIMVARLSSQLHLSHSVRVEPARLFEIKTPRQLSLVVAENLAAPIPGTAGERAVLETTTARLTPGPVIDASEPIAIIGIAGRYPASSSLDEFWENLGAGRDCISEIPGDRWPVDEYFDPNPETAAKNGKSYAKWGGFISGLHEFDSVFFKISPLEAESMNPKERLVLETVWHLLEDAGHTPKSLSEETVGVFFGVTRAGWDAYPGTFSSVPNRVSYFFDFKGPSVPIDTMCSSSLVAIHEACQHIRSGDCDVAVAGGVNVYLHPSHFAVLAHGRFLSPDGRCRSFGAGANGMTPGEGVGAVLLKPLSRALRDRDRIHGVIRGSATNHGGNANGFTVPNPAAHRDLILRALRNGNVHPRRISCVEAHGTGTVLGDPVEIRGLSEAYRQFTPERGFCRISSLKSNIGHLEAAAGIAALTKVLMQMRRRKLAPSLHASTLNPNIDFASSPFKVQQSLEAWDPVDANGRAMPRMAAISSFGAGGSNAHLIVEEAPPLTPDDHEEAKPRLVVLSAKSGSRLLEMARNLGGFLNLHPQTSLRDLSHTLQAGREWMDERLAIVVSSVKELAEKLAGLKDEKGGLDGLYRGRVGKRSQGVAQDSPQPQDLESLAHTWVLGGMVDFDPLHQGEKPRRIGLPSYPFARERIPPAEFAENLGETPESAAAPPLARRNTSVPNKPQFTTTLGGREFFLAHHVVGGEKMLPAAAYLEMARSAGEQFLRENSGRANGHSPLKPVFLLLDVVWARPLVVNEPMEVHIALKAEPEGGVRFEIQTTKDAEIRTHAQGRVEMAPPASVPVIDLAAARAGSGLHFSPGQVYATFEALGLAYGPGHQGMESLWIGAENLVARLKLPSVIGGSLKDYVLHPAMLDAAFQASIGFAFERAHIQPAQNGAGVNGNEKRAMDRVSGIKPSLPFSLERLEVYRPCDTSMWAVLRRGGAPNRSQAVEEFDLDLCDDSGAVSIRIRGFSARVLPGAGAGSTKSSLMLRIPKWEPAELPPASRLLAPRFERWVVLAVDMPNILVRTMGDRLGAVHPLIIPITLKGKNPAKDFNEVLLKSFLAIRQILDDKPEGESLIQVIMPPDDAHLALTGVVGILRTARMEFPQLSGQLIQVRGEPSGGSLEAVIRANAASPGEDWVRYREGRREISTSVEYEPSVERTPWRKKGVYLITGGLGGLGRVFAREIAAQAPGAGLILAGRSPEDDKTRGFLHELKELGARAEYRQTDLRPREAAKALVKGILTDFGALHGVLHAAGVLRDGYLIKKSARDIETVLGPKVTGAINLDEATRAAPLDFFVLFSSLAAMGNPGQGDYAAANAFLDGFAQRRNQLVANGERHGATVSVAWPFWKEGGMRMDEVAERVMTRNTGLEPMDTQSGLQAFYQCLSAGQAHVQVFYGDRARLTQMLSGNPLDPPPVSAQEIERPGGAKVNGNVTSPKADATLAGQVTRYLKGLICEILKFKPEDMDSAKELSAYGLDSIIVLDVNNRLERDFPRLSKTLFFEYSTLDDLAGYFVRSHRETLERMFHVVSPPPPPPPAPPRTPAPVVELGNSNGFHSRQGNGGPSRPVGVDELIAKLKIEVVHAKPASANGAPTPARWPGWSSLFQSFAIFKKVDPGFSFSRLLAGTSVTEPDEDRYLRGQIDLRRLLFRKEDFQRAAKIMDLGCGRAADLIELSLDHPHIQGHGLTIDQDEARFAAELIRRKGLSARIQIHARDNAAHDYDTGYDLAYSIQVMHFIPEVETKRTLFRKIATALRPEGALLMAEFVCLLSKPIRDATLGTTVHTAREWADVLADAGLLIEEVIDASSGIINFLHDPDLDRHTAGLDESKQREIRKFNRQIAGLENQWVCYSVMRVMRDLDSRTTKDRAGQNWERLNQRTPWDGSFTGMPDGAAALYRNLAGHFGDCVDSEGQKDPLRKPEALR